MGKLRPEGETLGETLTYLRAAHSKTAYRQLSYAPVYFSQEDAHKAIDELERHILTREPLSPLQSMAVRLLLEGIGEGAI
jgi:hypothetical protein